MPDIIIGPVIDVIDGDTFDMRVTHIGTNNKEKYNGNERVRIADIDAPELRTLAGLRSKEQLFRKLNGEKVRCDVQARDIFGRIVAEVKIL